MKVICKEVSEECNQNCPHSRQHYYSSDMCDISICDSSEDAGCIPVEEKSTVTEYKILWNTINPRDLVKQVNEYIKSGWEPVNRASCILKPDENMLYWYQTIIKRG